MEPLNLVVHGSSGTCRQMAGWLRGFGGSALAAANSIQAARATSASGWSGPAQLRFAEQAAGPRDQCDDLQFTCDQYATGLDSFADALDAVGRLMDDAAAKAAAGGLTVEERLLILMPDPIGNPPSPPNSPYGDDVTSYDYAVQMYNKSVDAYNVKVAVFNECSDIVKEARKQEDQAHANLRGDLQAREGAPSWESLEVAGEKAKDLIDTVKYHDMARGKILDSIDQLDETASTYAQLANAERGLPEVSKEMRELYQRAADNAGVNRDRYLTLLRRWGDGVRLPSVLRPQRIPVGHASYQGANRVLAIPERIGHTKVAKTVIRAIPIAGDVLTVGDEIRKAATGEQTWKVTGIRSIGLVAAGNIGSFVGGAAFALAGTGVGAAIGAVTGGVPMIGTIPAGAVLGGAGGAVVGDAALSHGVDILLNRVLSEEIDPAYAQPRLESMPHI